MKLSRRAFLGAAAAAPVAAIIPAAVLADVPERLPDVVHAEDAQKLYNYAQSVRIDILYGTKSLRVNALPSLMADLREHGLVGD